MSNFFLIAIFFILLPPFILPVGLPSIINTYSLSRIIFLMLFVYIYIKKKAHITKNNSIEVILITVFFFFQSLSIINAINFIVFSQRFEKLLFGIIIFFNCTYLLSKNYELKKKIILVYFFSCLIKIIFEISVYLHLFQSLHLDMWFHPSFINTLQINIDRNRPYFDLFLESNLPFIFYVIYVHFDGIFKKIILLLFSFIILFLSFVSEWRGRFINALFVLLIIFINHILQIRIYVRTILFFGLIVSVLFSFLYILDKYQLSINNYSIIDRFSEIQPSSSINNVNSTNWRINMFKEAINKARIHVFGVGLGNFYDNLENNLKFSSYKSSNSYKLGQEALVSGPHNIFFQYLAESGIPGLLSLLVMLSVFLAKDLKYIRSKNKYRSAKTQFTIYAFWSLIVGSLFYPATDLSFYLSFFLFRAMILNISYKKNIYYELRRNFMMS